MGLQVCIDALVSILRPLAGGFSMPTDASLLAVLWCCSQGASLLASFLLDQHNARTFPSGSRCSGFWTRLLDVPVVPAFGSRNRLIHRITSQEVHSETKQSERNESLSRLVLG